MHNFRQYIEGVNLRTLIDNSGDTLLQELDVSKIRSHFIGGFDKLLSLEDSCKGKAFSMTLFLISGVLLTRMMP